MFVTEKFNFICFAQLISMHCRQRYTFGAVLTHNFKDIQGND